MRKKKIYLVGIKGVAMTSLAVYFIQRGYKVTGSDVEDVFPTDEILKSFRIKVKKGFSAENMEKDCEAVVVTGAHGGMTNIEAQTAQKLGIPTYMHGQFLGKLMENKFGISVAGCHGKTTTSSMIAFLLDKSGLKPSYAIGTARINDLGPAGHFGSGKIFIAEADEYMTCPQTDPTPRFLWQNPKILVITNIEYDHPDAYSDIKKVREAYLKFINKLENDAVIVACIDNKNTAEILKNSGRQIITYGFSPRADFQIYRAYFTEGAGFMRIKHGNIDLGEYMLSISGKHNMLNALAAMIVADQVGISRDSIKKHLKLYTGCKRRFEKMGEAAGVLLYDDYAHHPSEIRATITAARDWFPGRRLIVLFQPHTFSRTKMLFSDFASSFTEADLVVICDIYPSAREKSDTSINSNMLSVAANKYKKNAVYLAGKKGTLSYLARNAKPGDLIMTMGAGDIYLWHKDIRGAFGKK